VTLKIKVSQLFCAYLICSIAAPNTSLSNPNSSVQLHKEMTNLIVKWEEHEVMAPLSDDGLMSLRGIFNNTKNLLFADALAIGNDWCLFGGWPSRRNEKCVRPFSSLGMSVADETGTPRYDSKFYCGSKTLFRCNPLVFGPGTDPKYLGNRFKNLNGIDNNGSPYKAGICVDVSDGYVGLSKKCQAVSEELDKARISNGEKPWRESGFLESQDRKGLESIKRLTLTRCQNDRDRINSDGMCDSLESALTLSNSDVVDVEVKEEPTEVPIPRSKSSVLSAEDSLGVPDCGRESTMPLDTNQLENVEELNAVAIKNQKMSVEEYEVMEVDLKYQGLFHAADASVDLTTINGEIAQVTMEAEYNILGFRGTELLSLDSYDLKNGNSLEYYVSGGERPILKITPGKDFDVKTGGGFNIMFWNGKGYDTIKGVVAKDATGKFKLYTNKRSAENEVNYLKASVGGFSLGGLHVSGYKLKKQN
jgi:hypothetical protein